MINSMITIPKKKSSGNDGLAIEFYHSLSMTLGNDDLTIEFYHSLVMTLRTFI